MKRALLAFLVYCALTIALTYPLILQLGSVFPHDAGDPVLNTWILWWNAHAVPYTTSWWNAPFFYPVSGTLAFSEHLLGLSVFATPIQWLGFSPAVAYNVVLLLTFPLCSIGAYLLVREISQREDAAFIAGLVFGFAPYRIAQLAHIQVLAAYAMPFALLGLHRYVRDPRVRWLVLFGASWCLQALSNGYYLLFFGLVVGLWILWFAPPWRNRKTSAAIAAAWAIASLPLIPLLWQYQVIHQRFRFARDFGTMVFFGADVMSLLNAAPALSLWGHLHVFKRAEDELFPGITIAALVLAGVVLVRHLPVAPRSRVWWWARTALAIVAAIAGAIALSIFMIGSWTLKSHGHVLLSVANPVKPVTFVLAVAILLLLTSGRVRSAYSRQSILGFYAVAGFLTWLLSLGPSPSFMGDQLMYRGPYSLLMFLPGFSALRVPARFWMMTVLCLSVVGAMIFARLTERLGPKRLAFAALLALGVLADGWALTFPLANTPVVRTAEGCGGEESRISSGAVLELPIGYVIDDVAAMYRSIWHRRPVVNGYSGHFPPHYRALRFALALWDPKILPALASHGTSHIIVNADGDENGRLKRYVSGQPGVMLVCSDAIQSIYRLTEKSAAETIERGVPLTLVSVEPNAKPDLLKYMLDGDLTTRWESGPQSEGTAVVIDLGTDHSVDAVELKLGPFPEDFARELAIEASEDAKTWREVWRGGSARLAFDGGIKQPSEMPLRYELSPPTTTRYLRLRLLSNDETYYWSIAELAVYGR